ncbi:MAG: FkbM family methyltransferase [Rhizobacter sp.]
MYLDNLIPNALGAFFSPFCLFHKLKQPTMVSYGLMANLLKARDRGLFAGVQSIVDVGANIGQYAYMAHAIFPTLPIHSFEPVPQSLAALKDNFARYGIPGEVHSVALGAECGQAEFLLQDNLEQSSFFEKLDRPVTSTHAIQVMTATLDSYQDRLPAIKDCFLKIDTQGFEAKVLQGASAFIRRCSVVQLEVAIRPSYAHQPPAHQLLSMMDDFGFDLVEILDMLRRPATEGNVLAEADLLFRRKNR